MKEQHRYGIIFSVLLLTIAFIFNDYATNNSHKKENIKKVVENINKMNRMSDEFLSEAVSLGEFTASGSKLTILESEFDVKSNKVSHNMFNGKNYFTSENIEELKITNRNKDESINL